MKNKSLKQIFAILLVLVASYFGIDLVGQTNEGDTSTVEQSTQIEETGVTYGEAYTEKEDVANYLFIYEELPKNYLTKDEAHDLGWDPEEGNLREVAGEEAIIGGDHFGNFERLLPEENGRDYREADVNYDGGHRGAERLVYSEDGLIFYTKDHYDSFIEVERE